jgi:glucose/arabinose dehydrogenase
MPALFGNDRAGFVERWLVAESFATGLSKTNDPPPGDHRLGRIAFLSLGCAACHFVPDIDRAEQKDLDRIPLVGLGDRMSAGDIAAFLGNPHARYPDGRMPRLPVAPGEARDIAAYLLLWSKPAEPPAAEPPTPQEIRDAVRRLGGHDAKSAALVLLREKGCTACHPGLGESRPREVPVTGTGGCLAGKIGPRFAFPGGVRESLAAYLAEAGRDRFPSPFDDRQRRLARAGCVRCHQRDSDRPPPIEEVGATLGGAHLQELPFLRTPRLTNPHQKLTRGYLAATVREGAPGLRWPRYLYRMPAFGPEADTLVQALAEADGEPATEVDPPAPTVADPTVGTLHGPRLVGVQGYGCVSCHVWAGQLLGSPDPVATGPDLTRTAGRLRRDWFDRFLEDPLRYYPGTPMPAVFEHGSPAKLTAVLDGEAAKQKDALWAYLSLGKKAPSPKPPAPVPVAAPGKGEALIAAQIPIRLPDGRAVESLSVLTADHDLLVYDIGEGKLYAVFTGGQISRNVVGRTRQFLAVGTPAELKTPTAWELLGKPRPSERTFLGYRQSMSSVVLAWRFRFGDASVEAEETIHIDPNGKRELLHAVASPGSRGASELHALPAAKNPPPWEGKPIVFPEAPEGSLERPGYRAIAYPRPKLISGEDRIMPGAVAVRPRDSQVFVASMKTGELFALRDPAGDGKHATFENYARSFFQDALSMLAEDDGMYVLHRRNLTKLVETSSTGVADRFDRVAALPHGVADTYDMAYGLARDREGRFIFGYAPYANATLPGSGGVLRLTPGKPPEEVAFGLRNALGWCAGPEGAIFITDNQGDWVATNKLIHVGPGRFYGWPNPAQRQHVSKPAGKAVVWVPYGWARSINGVAYDSTGGRFGPFAGQFFLAELMFGGAIVRADVEKVNGVYQGACFPFWGKGLLGPLCLAFDPRGHLYVGGITEPGWMAQPDRGALFRIDYTGQAPFEMQTIRVQPRGFRVVFTRPVDPRTAGDPAAYHLEHYRYEYTGAYGSPELDRTSVKVEKAVVSTDGLAVELTTDALVRDRVYLLTAAGVRSTAGEPLVHPTGAYTLNEVPGGKE